MANAAPHVPEQAVPLLPSSSAVPHPLTASTAVSAAVHAAVVLVPEPHSLLYAATLFRIAASVYKRGLIMQINCGYTSTYICSYVAYVCYDCVHAVYIAIATYT